MFRKVVHHHCLGAVWARRDRKSGREPPTILATIEQFNRVSLRVTATILKQSERKPARVRVITKWIEIAQVRKMAEEGDESCSMLYYRKTFYSLPDQFPTTPFRV